MAKRKRRQVPDLLRRLEDEVLKLEAKKEGPKALTKQEKKRYAELDHFFDWLVRIRFYHKINRLSPYIDEKYLDEIVAEIKKKRS